MIFIRMKLNQKKKIKKKGGREKKKFCELANEIVEIDILRRRGKF